MMMKYTIVYIIITILFSLNSSYKLALQHKLGVLSSTTLPSPSLVILKALDLEDILLDDDLQLLNKLREKMSLSLDSNNIPNGISLHNTITSKELNNRIKYYFSTRKCSQEDELRVFKSYINSNIDSLDIISSILLIDGCNRHHLKLPKLINPALVISAMSKSSILLTGSQVYKALACLKDLQLMHGIPARAFIKLLWDRVNESSILLSVSDVCPAAYCMQNCDNSIPEVSLFLRYFSKCLTVPHKSSPVVVVAAVAITMNDEKDVAASAISSKSICSAIYGMKRMRATPDVKKFLSVLTDIINESGLYYHSVNVCIALNGLQSMDDESIEVRQLLDALLSRAIDPIEQGVDRAGDREISMALFGLQRMGKASAANSGTNIKSRNRVNISKQLMKVLQYISSLLDVADKPFEAKRLGFCITGLTSLTSEIKEVDDIIGKLATKANAATTMSRINGQEVSMMMHGLVGMKSESANVNKLLKSLSTLIRGQDNINMSNQEVRSALSGIQGLKSGAPEVNDFLYAVSDLLCRQQPIVRPYDMSTMLYALQGIGSSTFGSRKLMQEYVRLLSTVSGEFTMKELAMCIYGLKKCSSKVEETLQLVDLIHPHFATSTDVLTSNNVAIMLYGMQKMTNRDIRVKKLIKAIAKVLPNTRGKFNSRGISMMINGMQGFNSDSDEVKELLVQVTILLKQAVTGGFECFDDFHQVSSAMRGLANMSSNCDEVDELVDVLSVMLLSKNRHRPQTGKVYAASTTSTDKMLAKRISYALFGMQRLSPSKQSTQDIVAFINDKVSSLGSNTINLKSLSMCSYVFNGVVGDPVGNYEQLLSLIAQKCALLPSSSSSSHHRGNSKGGAKKQSDYNHIGTYTALKNCLRCLSKLNKANGATNQLLTKIATEIKHWNFQSIDRECMYLIFTELGHIACIKRIIDSGIDLSSSSGSSASVGVYDNDIDTVYTEEEDEEDYEDIV